MKAKSLTRRSHCFGWGLLGCQEKLDEQEAVNRRAGTSVQLANSPPGSLASMVPHRLPVQQLILWAAGAIAVAELAGGVQGWGLALHTHPVALPEVAHPASEGLLAVQAARRDGHQLELHTVPSPFTAISCSSFLPGFCKASCSY